jgi:hypothetical protein
MAKRRKKTSHKRKSAKRVAAGRKAARTRARRRMGGTHKVVKKTIKKKAASIVRLAKAISKGC